MVEKGKTSLEAELTVGKIEVNEEFEGRFLKLDSRLDTLCRIHYLEE